MACGCKEALARANSITMRMVSSSGRVTCVPSELVAKPTISARIRAPRARAWPNSSGGLGRGVPEPNIKGRAMFVWAPLSRMFVDLMGSPVLPSGAPVELLTAIADCLAKRPSPAETIPPSGKAALQALTEAAH